MGMATVQKTALSVLRGRSNDHPNYWEKGGVNMEVRIFEIVANHSSFDNLLDPNHCDISCTDLLIIHHGSECKAVQEIQPTVTGTQPVVLKKHVHC